VIFLLLLSTSPFVYRSVSLAVRSALPPELFPFWVFFTGQAFFPVLVLMVLCHGPFLQCADLSSDSVWMWKNPYSSVTGGNWPSFSQKHSGVCGF